jgi:hypothetical protein
MPVSQLSTLVGPYMPRKKSPDPKAKTWAGIDMHLISPNMGTERYMLQQCL